MKISNSVLERVQLRIKGMLEDHQEEMEQAYLRSGDDPLDVSFKVKISPDKAKLKIITSINFVKDRCQDKATDLMDEEQINLFEEEGGEE